jgi:hypothetical protein
MMLLSRFWYAVLAILAALCMAVVILAVGQYNRRNHVAMTEVLAGDSQVVKWALQIDARRRIDALLPAAVDKGIQDAVVAANGQDRIPAKSREEARKALGTIAEKVPPDFKPDAIFIVDRDGRLVAQVGYDKAATFEDFELGGYAAVNDALHGYLRDDTWVWGGALYRVVARPIEYDVTQPPAGAIVGIRAVDRKFAVDLAHLTRTNVAFYAANQKIAGAANDPGDEAMPDLIISELGPKLDADKNYTGASGRSDVRLLNENTGAIYTRLEGDAWEAGAGVAVVRTQVVVGGPMGFLSGADDKDKGALTSVSSILTLLLTLLGGVGLGILFSLLEHTFPLNEMVSQADRLKKGEIDLLQLPRFRGAFRNVATDLNDGIERVSQKAGGGGVRKVADLEQILGPAPAQPAMSAFAFPMPGAGMSETVPVVPPASPSRPPASSPGSHAGARPSPAGPPLGRPPVHPPAQALQRPQTDVMPPQDLPRPETMPNMPPQRSAMPAPAMQRPTTGPTMVAPMGMPQPTAARPIPAPTPAQPLAPDAEEEATMVAAIPQDVLDQAKAEAGGELAAWKAVYEEFIRVKKQCNEPTDGLTFEKFQLTLKKNRDALIERHKCKRVKFTVYVKDGRASLKATPVKE